MKPVTLQFPSLDFLLEFKEITGTYNCTIHSTRFLLTCELTEAQQQLAIQNFGAAIVKDKVA